MPQAEIGSPLIQPAASLRQIKGIRRVIGDTRHAGFRNRITEIKKVGLIAAHQNVRQGRNKMNETYQSEERNYRGGNS
jgi:hypothetical protein